jgi:hypothetical protein
MTGPVIGSAAKTQLLGGLRAKHLSRCHDEDHQWSTAFGRPALDSRHDSLPGSPPRRSRLCMAGVSYLALHPRTLTRPARSDFLEPRNKSDSISTSARLVPRVSTHGLDHLDDIETNEQAPAAVCLTDLRSPTRGSLHSKVGSGDGLGISNHLSKKPDRGDGCALHHDTACRTDHAAERDLRASSHPHHGQCKPLPIGEAVGGRRREPRAPCEVDPRGDRPVRTGPSTSVVGRTLRSRGDRVGSDEVRQKSGKSDRRRQHRVTPATPVPKWVPSGCADKFTRGPAPPREPASTADLMDCLVEIAHLSSALRGRDGEL